MSDAMETYMADDDGMAGVYLSEMLPIVTGWNKPWRNRNIFKKNEYEYEQ